MRKNSLILLGIFALLASTYCAKSNLLQKPVKTLKRVVKQKIARHQLSSSKKGHKDLFEPSGSPSPTYVQPCPVDYLGSTLVGVDGEVETSDVLSQHPVIFIFKGSAANFEQLAFKSGIFKSFKGEVAFVYLQTAAIKPPAIQDSQEFNNIFITSTFNQEAVQTFLTEFSSIEFDKDSGLNFVIIHRNGGHIRIKNALQRKRLDEIAKGVKNEVPEPVNGCSN